MTFRGYREKSGQGMAFCEPRPSRRSRRRVLCWVAATIRENETYGGDQVSTWSILRSSCKPRSPVGLVNQPGNNVSANNELALAA